MPPGRKITVGKMMDMTCKGPRRTKWGGDNGEGVFKNLPPGNAIHPFRLVRCLLTKGNAWYALNFPVTISARPLNVEVY